MVGRYESTGPGKATCTTFTSAVHFGRHYRQGNPDIITGGHGP